MLLEIRLIEVFRYPTGTKLAGIIFVHKFGEWLPSSLGSKTEAMKELCQDSTLKNLVIMTHQFGEVSSYAEMRLQTDLSDRYGFIQAVVPLGAKIYRCTSASEPDLGALRIILAGRSVVPEIQQEPISKGSQLEQAAVRPVEPSKDKEVQELRRELEEQKRRAQQEADAFEKRIAEMQSKEESIRKELEEEKRRARKEADGFRKCIVELQSKLEEDRHTSGKTFTSYNFRHVPINSRVFLVGPPAHLALQRVYPSTGLHPNSPTGSTTHSTARSMNNGCKTFRRMTSSGSLTIWIRHVTTPSFLTGRSSWPAGSGHSRSFRSRFTKVLTRTRNHMHHSYDTPNIVHNSLPPSNH